jgi:hypothetical protein
MYKFVAMGLVSAALLAGGMTGCTDPIPAMQDRMAQPSQVIMADYWLQHQLHVDVLPPERIGAGQLKPNVQLRNLTDSPRSVDFKITYLDERRIAVDNPIGWQHATVPPRGYTQLDIPASMSAAARDFTIEIRKAE